MKTKMIISAVLSMSLVFSPVTVRAESISDNEMPDTTEVVTEIPKTEEPVVETERKLHAVSRTFL